MNKKFMFIFAITLLNSKVAIANVTEIVSEFKDKSFKKDALKSWRLHGNFDVEVTECDGKSIAGGFKVAADGSMTKKYTFSQEITDISINFDLYVIDKWDSVNSDTNKSFRILINDQYVHSVSSMETQGSEFCGANLLNNQDRIIRISLTTPINAKEFTLKLEFYFQDDNVKNRRAYWGIRDLSIYSVDGQGSQLVADELNDDNFDTSSWKTSFSGKTYNCNKKTILGGYKVAGLDDYMGKVFKKLPKHSFITFSFKAYFLDKFDYLDTIQVYLDGKMIHEQNDLRMVKGKGSDICGLDDRDSIQGLVFTVPHTADSATFQIKLNINTVDNIQNVSFGIRQFQVYVNSPCPVIYSDVNGQGKSLQVCDSLPNLKGIGWTTPIKGIYVPYNYQITVYKDSNYQGKKYTIQQTDLNLSGDNYVMVNQAFDIEVAPNKLKRNS